MRGSQNEVFQQKKFGVIFGSWGTREAKKSNTKKQKTSSII